MPSTQTVISVLMSAYNGSKYIEEQLDSLRNQSRQIDEVVIIDDCSTDDTSEIVTNYINQYDLKPGWKLVKNSTNQGWKKNFMSGLSLLHGDLIFFSDQDDIWYGNKIEVYENILNKNSEINVLASQEVIWNGQELRKPLLIEDESFNYVEMQKGNDNYLICCSGCTMAVRNTYVQKVMPYYQENWAHDDFFWKMSVLDGSMALLNSPSILHRMTGYNESRRKRNKKRTLLGLETDKIINDSLVLRLKEDKSIYNKDSKLTILKHWQKSTQLRLSLVKKHNLFSFILLFIAYRDTFRRNRQIVGDLVIGFGKK